MHPSTVQGYGFTLSDDLGFLGLGGPHLASDHLSGETCITEAIFNDVFLSGLDDGFFSNFLL